MPRLPANCSPRFDIGLSAPLVVLAVARLLWACQSEGRAPEKQLEALQLEPGQTIDGALFMGLSTALSGRLVSPINPRVLLLGQQAFMAFQRGVQQVELATMDRLH